MDLNGRLNHFTRGSIRLVPSPPRFESLRIGEILVGNPLVLA